MKLKLRRVSLTLMMSLLAMIASAQTTLRGVGVDQEGEPVIGASVLIEGAKVATGTVTDYDGNFILKTNPGAKLRISFVGYKTVTVQAKDGMRVVLEEESTMLKGVEIVAASLPGSPEYCTVVTPES